MSGITFSREQILSTPHREIFSAITRNQHVQFRPPVPDDDVELDITVEEPRTMTRPRSYTPRDSREFLWRDEWLGILLILILFGLGIHDSLLWFIPLGVFAPGWALAVYGIGYPCQFKFERLEPAGALLWWSNLKRWWRNR